MRLDVGSHILVVQTLVSALGLAGSDDDLEAGVILLDFAEEEFFFGIVLRGSVVELLSDFDRAVLAVQGDRVRSLHKITSFFLGSCPCRFVLCF